MIEGIRSNSLVIKKDASYAMKNFTFCAEPDMIINFYRCYPEIIEVLMANIEDGIENIVAPTLSSLENFLYVFENSDQPSNSHGTLLEEAKDVCRSCNLEALHQMTSETNQVLRTISSRICENYFSEMNDE